MDSDPWAEYLAAVSEHLWISRRAVEEGAAIPSPPSHPAGPVPDELGDQVHRLAVAYDQFALEVTTRMVDIGRCLRARRATTLLHPQFVDRKV